MAGFYADQFGKKKRGKKGAKVVKFKAGDLVEVVGNGGGHNQVGMEFKVQGYNGMYVRCAGSQYNFMEQDLKLLPISKADLLVRCEEVKNEYNVLQAKLEYLEETKLAEVDEAKFRTYQVKKLIENKKLTSEEKAQQISFLFA